jgi:hypothetical protein
MEQARQYTIEAAELRTTAASVNDTHPLCGRRYAQWPARAIL